MVGILSSITPGYEIIFMANFMFFVTFAMGYLPSKMSQSKNVMNLVSLYGAGLLVGAALIIIVPEGMTVLSNAINTQAQEDSLASENGARNASGSTKGNTDEIINRYVGASLIIGFATMLVIDQGFHIIQNKQHSPEPQISNAIKNRLPTPMKPRKTKKHEYYYDSSIEQKTIESINCITPESYLFYGSTDQQVVKNIQKGKLQDNEGDSLQSHLDHHHHQCIIEISEECGHQNLKIAAKIRRQKFKRRYSQDNAADIDTSTNSCLDLQVQKDLLKVDKHMLIENEAVFTLHEQVEVKDQVIVTTIGLVIHCIADGVALGTSVFLSSKFEKESGLGILIFLAILLHKAPGAIGFGTYLYHEGLRNWGIIKHLLAFTLACPLTALLSYAILSNIPIGENQNDLMFWVGILLIISAGSFIYVATIHILPEVLQGKSSHGHGHSHDQSQDISSQKSTSKTQSYFGKGTELIVIILGLVSPLFLTFLKDE